MWEIWLQFPYRIPFDPTYLFVSSLPYVEDFTPEGEHPISVPPNHAEASNSQGFSWVSLSENESTIFGILGASIISVI